MAGPQVQPLPAHFTPAGLPTAGLSRNTDGSTGKHRDGWKHHTACGETPTPMGGNPGMGRNPYGVGGNP